MDITEILIRLKRTKYFATPKSKYEEPDLIEWFGEVASSATSWLIPCTHRFFEPCQPQQLIPFLAWLDHEIPAEFENFYRYSNGAELFKVIYKSKVLGNYSHVQYEICDSSSLVQINQKIYGSFRSQIHPSSKYWEISKLNYFAFCKVGDSDYLAVSLGKADEGSIFFLDHEYSFLPYGEESTRDAYNNIARSFEELIEILISTLGEGGSGTQWIPL